MKTFIPTVQNAKADWFIVDASGETLGRLASTVARVLHGKHKPEFTPNLDLGDHVIVINAEKVKLTGNKLHDKMYYRHSGYPGGLREENLAALMSRKPERVVELAIKGMLPDNKLGASMYRKLKVYAGPNHPHQPQNPARLTIDARRSTRDSNRSIGDPRS